MTDAERILARVEEIAWSQGCRCREGKLAHKPDVPECAVRDLAAALRVLVKRMHARDQTARIFRDESPLDKAALAATAKELGL